MLCSLNHSSGGIVNQELSERDIYHLGRHARYAAEGWFYIELAPDSESNRCLGLVHEDVPCPHSDCTFDRVRGHKHTATPEQRQEMQDLYVTPWLTHLFKQEEAAAGKQADIDELERMWSLSPEPFFCNFELQRQDEARERAEKDIDELWRMWRLLDTRTPQSYHCGSANRAQAPRW
jgi:hypothetical protein